MKNLFLFIFLSLAVLATIPPGEVQAQELTNESEWVKENHPEVFTAVKSTAAEQWQDNYIMVVSEINTQVDAILYLVNNVDLNDRTQNKIFSNAFNNWKSKRASYNSLEDNIYEISCNWVMVRAEFDEQYLSHNSLK